jgi:hypothetical protein
MKLEKPSTESTNTLENAEKPKKVPKTEFGGFAAEGLPEPTRYGDWDVRGRCSDF